MIYLLALRAGIANACAQLQKVICPAWQVESLAFRYEKSETSVSLFSDAVMRSCTIRLRISNAVQPKTAQTVTTDTKMMTNSEQLCLGPHVHDAVGDRRSGETLFIQIRFRQLLEFRGNPQHSYDSTATDAVKLTVHANQVSMVCS